MPNVETIAHDESGAIEEARSEVAACERRRPDVVALAELASLARFIEPELLRAIRLELGERAAGSTRMTVASESAVWFSPFVASRGADGITFLPEYCHVLRPRLAAHRLLLEDTRRVVEECHKSAPDVLQWEERIVYLALTGRLDELENEIVRGIKSISQGTRPPLVNWILEMGPRLPQEVSNNALLNKLHSLAAGLSLRRTPTGAGSKGLILDFSSLPTRELGSASREQLRDRGRTASHCRNSSARLGAGGNRYSDTQGIDYRPTPCCIPRRICGSQRLQGSRADSDGGWPRLRTRSGLFPAPPVSYDLHQL